MPDPKPKLWRDRWLENEPSNPEEALRLWRRLKLEDNEAQTEADRRRDQLRDDFLACRHPYRVGPGGRDDSGWGYLPAITDRDRYLKGTWNMQPETVHVETLESLLTYLAAHTEHETVYRGALPRGKGEKGVRKVARSAAQPVIFADSETRTVQVELSYWKGGDEDRRKVVIWQAAKGTPPEVEMLRRLRGKAVLCSAFLEALRCLMPGEQHDDLKEAVDAVQVLAWVQDDHAKLTFRGGDLTAPDLLPISWTVDHDSATLALPAAKRPHGFRDPGEVRVEETLKKVDTSGETVAEAFDRIEKIRDPEPISGAAPPPSPVTTHGPARITVTAHAPAQFRLTLRPKMELTPDRRAVLCSYALDVEDAFEIPADFRRYVSGFDWASVGAVVVFGKPEEPVGPRGHDSAIKVGETIAPGEIEIIKQNLREAVMCADGVEISIDAALFDASPEKLEGMLRRVVQAARGERPPIPARFRELSPFKIDRRPLRWENINPAMGRLTINEEE